MRALAAQAEGYSSKAVSCADGEAITQAFPTNDCTEPVDETQPATGSTTVECTADGIKQTVYATADCTGTPTTRITGKFGECKNPDEGYSSKSVSCADGEAVVNAFSSNDCSGPVDETQTVPADGSCCDMEGNCGPAGGGAAAVTTPVGQCCDMEGNCQARSFASLVQAGDPGTLAVIIAVPLVVVILAVVIGVILCVCCCKSKKSKAPQVAEVEAPNAGLQQTKV